ncbi:hypothetical protein ACHAW6_002849 [Cyclotella cf. meneghiniana]
MADECLPDHDLDAISNVDFRIIGLSPQYWTHTPLLIGDLIGLPLINGVDCFIVPPNIDCESDSHNNRCKKASLDSDTSRHIFPLSKVLLQGIITAIDRRPNGCILIVIDDGTGSIDCRYWDEQYNHISGKDLFLLHSEHERSRNRETFSFVVGDCCEVLGKIKSMTSGTKHSRDNFGSFDSTTLDIRFGCIREVHASSVCLIDRRQGDSEIFHWLKCLKFSREVQQTIKSGKDVLSLLGKSITSSVLSVDGSSDFNLGTETGPSNVLGRECCQTPRRFRNALFYCHCEATLETLDSSFRYRDALLDHLLDMEAALLHSSHSNHASYIEDCVDLIGAESDAMQPPLMFTFDSIYKDENLSSTVRNIVASTMIPEANARKLVQNTFAAMTKDGILNLFDPVTDVYLFVSIERVIEPYLRNSSKVGAGMAAVPTAPPCFIRCIPKKRMRQIMNWYRNCFDRRCRLWIPHNICN